MQSGAGGAGFSSSLRSLRCCCMACSVTPGINCAQSPKRSASNRSLTWSSKAAQADPASRPNPLKKKKKKRKKVDLTERAPKPNKPVEKLPAEPPKPVFGVNMKSASKTGQTSAVGNTLMKAPEEFTKSQDVRRMRLLPVISSRSTSSQQPSGRA